MKLCTHCTAEYFARWRNDPADPHTLCPLCRASGPRCEHCAALLAPLPDPDQLSLWPVLTLTPRRPVAPLPADEPYTPPPRRASWKTRRKYPFH